MARGSSEDGARGGADRFATTHWSVVLASGRSSATDRQQALTTLCQTYWFPLYAFLRRQGYDRDESEDHVQAFFTQVLAKDYLKQVDPEKGKFRSFLMASLKHFVANELARQRALKRGGGQRIVSFDVEDAESRYARQPVDELTPQRAYERSWAMTVLQRTVDRLAEDYAGKDQQDLFEHLEAYLVPNMEEASYNEMGEQLGMTPSAVGVAIHRLRKRYRQLLQDEIAQTVAGKAQVEEEIRDLFDALGS